MGIEGGMDIITWEWKLSFWTSFKAFETPKEFG